MLIDQTTAAVLVAAISLLGTVIGLFFNSRLEHRLTVIEESKTDRDDFEALTQTVNKNKCMFSEEDIRCLRELNLKMEFLWGYYQGEAAKALKNPPSLDAIFTRIAQKESTIFKEYEELNAENRYTLIAYLEDTMNGDENEPDGALTITPVAGAKLLLEMLKVEQVIKGN